MSKTNEKSKTETPMMRQFMEIKKKHREEILFFRMGDFYEMFLDDAIYASKVLDIALTKRQDKIPMCGIPYHSVNNYIHPILESGRNIAICEQVEDPATVSGRIVKRDVVRILTPGSLYEEELLKENDRRCLASLSREDEDSIILATADLSTGELYLEKGSLDDLPSLVAAQGITEVVIDRVTEMDDRALPGTRFIRRNYATSGERAQVRQIENALQLSNLQALELENSERQVLAGLFFYVSEVAPGLSMSWQPLKRDYRVSTMQLDESALNTLEILKDTEGRRKNSLLGILDHTHSAGGKRQLSTWLARPSLELDEIQERHAAVAWFLETASARDPLSASLATVPDLERLVTALQNQPQVRHLGQALAALKAIGEIQELLMAAGDLPLLLEQDWQGKDEVPRELLQSLEEALFLDDLPPLLDERRFLKPGYSAPLDELYELSTSAQALLSDFENQEKAKWKIPTLKVKYNRVIGYFIEISKTLSSKAPEHYVRRQTLVGGERFTCDELKDLETRILGAKDEILTLNRSIFQALVMEVLEKSGELYTWAARLSRLDALFSFATAAKKYRYCRPEMKREGELSLKGSRHPVVEAIFKEEVFVPNDLTLNSDTRHLAILTGPNMAGKSTFIRQVGIIQIMAQAGSFVPAESASLPLADRVFTRIGAFDRLFQGESTFYVEMAECARIFQNFTARSLILLDEVGRGTSTYDGISIARAMIEYLNDAGRGRPHTLFATHYSELAELIEPHRGIVGLTVSVHENEGKIIFLRKIIEGTADKSYGIYVAALAGLPPDLITRSEVLLRELERDGIWRSEPVFRERPARKKKAMPGDDLQRSMFGSGDGPGQPAD